MNQIVVDEKDNGFSVVIVNGEDCGLVEDPDSNLPSVLKRIIKALGLSATTEVTRKGDDD